MNRPARKRLNLHCLNNVIEVLKDVYPVTRGKRVLSFQRGNRLLVSADPLKDPRDNLCVVSELARMLRDRAFRSGVQGKGLQMPREFLPIFLNLPYFLPNERKDFQ